MKTRFLKSWYVFVSVLILSLFVSKTLANTLISNNETKTLSDHSSLSCQRSYIAISGKEYYEEQRAFILTAECENKSSGEITHAADEIKKISDKSSQVCITSIATSLIKTQIVYILEATCKNNGSPKITFSRMLLNNLVSYNSATKKFVWVAHQDYPGNLLSGCKDFTNYDRTLNQLKMKCGDRDEDATLNITDGISINASGNLVFKETLDAYTCDEKPELQLCKRDRSSIK